MIAALFICFFSGAAYALLAREHHIALLGGGRQMSASRIAFSSFLRIGLIAGVVDALFYARGTITTVDAASIVAGYIVTMIGVNWR